MEHWEYLKPDGLRFVWDDTLFRPGTDSFLLSSLPKLSAGLRVCDLGCGTGLLQNPGRDCVAVAIGIRLDNGADRPADCLLNVGKIMADRVQVNFRPAVFFKIHIQSPLYNLFSLSYSFKRIL